MLHLRWKHCLNGRRGSGRRKMEALSEWKSVPSTRKQTEHAACTLMYVRECVRTCVRASVYVLALPAYIKTRNTAIMKTRTTIHQPANEDISSYFGGYEEETDMEH